MKLKLNKEYVTCICSCFVSRIEYSIASLVRTQPSPRSSSPTHQPIPLDMDNEGQQFLNQLEKLEAAKAA